MVQYFSYICLERSPYTRAKRPISCLPLSLQAPEKQRPLIPTEQLYHVFLRTACASGVICAYPGSQKQSTFSLKTSIDSQFTFKPTVHFKLIFVYIVQGLNKSSWLLFFGGIAIQLFQHVFLKTQSKIINPNSNKTYQQPADIFP